MCLECIISVLGGDSRDTGQILLKVREFFLKLAKISISFWLIEVPVFMLLERSGDLMRFCFCMCLITFFFILFLAVLDLCGCGSFSLVEEHRL